MARTTNVTAVAPGMSVVIVTVPVLSPMLPGSAVTVKLTWPAGDTACGAPEITSKSSVLLTWTPPYCQVASPMLVKTKTCCSAARS